MDGDPEDRTDTRLFTEIEGKFFNPANSNQPWSDELVQQPLSLAIWMSEFFGGNALKSWIMDDGGDLYTRGALGDVTALRGDIHAAEVPEPATMSLLGMSMLGFMRRRKKV